MLTAMPAQTGHACRSFVRVIRKGTDMAKKSVKTIVLLRGGIDSAVCLAKAVNDHGKDNVAGLNLFYGQRTRRELEMAKKLADHFGVRYIEMDISRIMDFSDAAVLADKTLEPGEDKYESQTEVPFRNGLMMAVAASVAGSLGAEIVQVAHNADEMTRLAYPDCRKEFFDAMGEALQRGTGGKLRLEMPFCGMTKKDVMELGKELKVPFELTWSCFVNDDEPCGYCVGCTGRAKAFASIGEKDPLI